MAVFGPIHVTYISWVLPNGRIVSTEVDAISEAQSREFAAELRSIIFFFSEDDLTQEPK